jgi:binding-protein-dependent transport system inner membrane component
MELADVRKIGSLRWRRTDPTARRWCRSDANARGLDSTFLHSGQSGRSGPRATGRVSEHDGMHSSREREFVEAARASGAGVGHMLFRQMLPNLWAPILVVFSLAMPSFITAEAALSFLQIGILEPTPDLGRMIAYSVNDIQADPWYMIFPGVTILLLVLAFNLLGDSVRDALDPTSSR